MATLSPFAAASAGAEPVRAQLDGEIYNASRLRELARGHGREAPSDPAGLARCLYQLYGAELVHAIDGKFALAIADERDGSLLLARDRFGLRPLYYRVAGQQLEFAGDPRQLGLAPDAELDPAAVAEYFERGGVAAPRTIFAGVSQLGPGQLLRWQPGAEPRVRTYWQPPEPTGGGLETIEEVLEELQRLLERSIGARLGEGPCAVLLDGGTAAALVAALLAQAGPEGGVRTVAIDLGEGGAAPPSPRAGEHRLLAPGPDGLAELALATVRSLAEPVAEPGLVALHAAARFAGENLAALAVPLGAAELFGPDLGRRRGLAAGLRRAPRPDWPDSARGRLPDGLAAAADRVAAAAGVELRAPYLEQEVAELAMTVLAEDHLRGGGSALLRALLDRVGPGAVGGAGRDASPWLRGPLRDRLREQLDGRGPAFAEGWLEGEAGRGASGKDGEERLWAAFAFAQWLEGWRAGDGR